LCSFITIIIKSLYFNQKSKYKTKKTQTNPKPKLIQKTNPKEPVPKNKTPLKEGSKGGSYAE
jgi:hypothetical protein